MASSELSRLRGIGTAAWLDSGLRTSQPPSPRMAYRKTPQIREGLLTDGGCPCCIRVLQARTALAARLMDLPGLSQRAPYNPQTPPGDLATILTGWRTARVAAAPGHALAEPEEQRRRRPALDSGPARPNTGTPDQNRVH